MKRNSILESNMVQTIGSAGESLAAGAIFTMPALFLWAEEEVAMPRSCRITLIALCGGILGVCFMVPLRNALIVKEHETLLYPEGTACAEVLRQEKKVELRLVQYSPDLVSQQYTNSLQTERSYFPSRRSICIQELQRRDWYAGISGTSRCWLYRRTDRSLPTCS